MPAAESRAGVEDLYLTGPAGGIATTSTRCYSVSSTMASFCSSVKLRRFRRWPRGKSSFEATVKTVLAASFLAALPIPLLTFARVLGRKVRSPVDLYFSALEEIAPSRKLFSEIWDAKSRCVAVNKLQFIASSCIARNAWMAIECFVLLGREKRLRRLSRRNSHRSLHHFVQFPCSQLVHLAIQSRTKFGTQNDDRQLLMHPIGSRVGR